MTSLQNDRFASMNGELLRATYTAETDSIPEARATVCAYAAAAGAEGEQLDAIRLAVSEALTNIVLYAYPWRTGHIHITARSMGSELWVLIADGGCGIHAGRDSEGLGLGLALISHVTDGFSVVERSSGGTELQLRFSLTGPAEPDRPQRLRPQRTPYERGSVASATRPPSSSFSTTK